jgi:hypothetical protein
VRPFGCLDQRIFQHTESMGRAPRIGREHGAEAAILQTLWLHRDLQRGGRGGAAAAALPRAGISATAVLLLGALTAAAVLLPARRAARVEPATALRAE